MSTVAPSATAAAASPRQGTSTCGDCWSKRRGTNQHRPGGGAALRQRRTDQPSRIIALADKAQRRLHQRYWKLLGAQKPPNRAVIAVARELVGFLWAALQPQRKLTARLKAAKLRLAACVEDIDYRHPRGLPKALVHELSASRWVAAHQSVVITGPTGVGKSYVACALAHKACRDGFTVAYRRVSRLYDELAQARAHGTYLTVLRRLAKIQLLVLDDFGLEPLGAAERKGLLEILEDRYNVTATLVTSQLDPTDWHAVIGDATVADAICDRLVHGAHRLTLRGESLRKAKAGLTTTEKSKK